MWGCARRVAVIASFVVASSSVASEWSETIGLASKQRTLCQTISKEFLLSTLDIDGAAHEAKLDASMREFTAALTALRQGDSSRGILASPSAQATHHLQAVEELWVPFEALLRNNVRHLSLQLSGGSVNFTALRVLEEVSTQSEPLLLATGRVVDALVSAGEVAGAKVPGLVEDIADRQLTYIQRMCKEVLLLSQGIALDFNFEKLSETKLLFEESHEGIIAGVRFAGIPVLANVCTLHQMSHVTFHYAGFHPLISAVLNAHSSHERQMLARTNAKEISLRALPLFIAMESAAELYHSDDHNCDPAASMSDPDWHIYIDTLGQARLLTQRVTWHFLQVALESNVHTSKVEVTVLMSETAQLLRSLIEGKQAVGILAPPAQKVVDLLEHAWDTWKIMSSILQEAVHAETITGVMVDRVAQLSHKVLMDLDIVVHQTEQAAYSSSHSSDAYLVELASQQEMLLFKMSVEASLVLYGIQVHENWLELNASRATFAATHTMLLHGTEATNSTPQLPKQRDVCMLSRMREVGDAFAQLEQSALNVAFGNRSELEELAALSSGALVKTESMADALLHGFSSCDNSTQLLPVDQWLALHQSAAAVAQWTLRATCTSLLQDHGRGEANLEAHIAKLDGAFQRLLFGSFSPRVPAPPSQVLLDDIFATVSPAMSSFKDAVGAQDMLRLVAAGDSLRQGAEEAQARYLREAQLQHPAWPGPRVDVVTRAMTEASTVFLAALREVSQRSGAGELEAAVAKFERLHRQAKEGGGGLEPVPVARKDISEQWDRVDQAWDAFRDQVLNAASEDLWRAEESLEGLLAELSASVSLYSQEDEEQVAGFPYTTIIYSLVGAFLLCCCCTIVLCNYGRKPGAKDSAKQLNLHQAEMSEKKMKREVVEIPGEFSP